MGATVDIQHLSVDLGTFKMRDVSLNVKDREVVALLGRTGSGKSVLLESIAGAYDYDAGTISIDGVDTQTIPIRSRKMGIVYQDCALFPHMSVIENVMYGLRRHGVSKKEAHKKALSMLELFHIAYLENRSPATISGGEAQRTALARALILKPRLLLMDEPFSALDPTTKAEMYEIMQSVHRRFDCTIIFVTHDFNEAQLLADRIAVLLDGTLREVVDAKRLFGDTYDEGVLAFLGKGGSHEDQ